MIGDFLREHGILTILVALGLIIAINIGAILQHKEQINHNKRGGFDISKSMSALKDPWKKEDEQWQELSRSVEALKKTKSNEEERENQPPPSSS
jgi:hypothetical protein